MLSASRFDILQELLLCTSSEDIESYLLSNLLHIQGNFEKNIRKGQREKALSLRVYRAEESLELVLPLNN